MMKKLFAQELVATRSALLVSQGILLGVIALSFGGAVLCAKLLAAPALGALGLILGVLAVIAYIPVVLVILVMNYWRSMYGQPGYFTMSVPVRGTTLFWAKTLYALLVSLAAFIVTGIGVYAAVATFAVLDDGSGTAAFRQVFEEVGPAILWVGVAQMLLQLIFSVISGAALMSLGATARFNHFGFGAPVIGGVILYFAMQILGLAATLVIPLGIRVAPPNTGAIVADNMFGSFVASLSTPGAQTEVVGLGAAFVVIIATVILGNAGARAVERRTSLL